MPSSAKRRRCLARAGHRIDTLAPDQRAAVQLVLRQGLSYGELSEMLGMPEETIRARARGGLEALAPDLPAPARAGEIADWLLGQQSEEHAARTRELLLADPAAHAVGGDRRQAAAQGARRRERPGAARASRARTASRSRARRRRRPRRAPDEAAGRAPPGSAARC